MKHLDKAFLIVFLSCISLWGVDTIPHEQRPFLDSLSNKVQSLEKDFVTSDQKSRSGKMLESLLKNFLKEKIVNEDHVLSSLDSFKDLKKKLVEVKNHKKNAEDKEEKITVADLLEMLKNDFEGVKDEDKDGLRNQLIALLLADLKRIGGSDNALNSKITAVVLDYLEAAKKLEPNKAIALSDELKKELGLNEKSKPEEYLPENIIKKIKEKGTLSEKAGMDLLSGLVGNSLENVESLGTALEPINRFLYDNQISITPKNEFVLPGGQFAGGFDGAMNKIGNIRNTPQPIPQDIDNPDINLGPIQNHGHSQGNSSGSAGSSGNSSGNPNGNSGGGTTGGVSAMGEIEDVDPLQAQACLNSVKAKRFNVELRLPGALCASTAVSSNPVAEKESFDTVIKSGQTTKCTIKLATAVHCLEGMRLQGRTIGVQIEGHPVNALVLRAGSVDGSRGKAVANGNPDLAMIIASVPCIEAKKLNIAKVPSDTEVKELVAQNSFSVMMQQNSQINANIDGENQATIAAKGKFEEFTDGRLGNFLRFDSRSALNKGFKPIERLNGDSARIKQGDSGGSALYCKMSGTNEVLEHWYLGAISHIAVLNNSSEGTIGGIASGQSLANLSKLMHGGSSEGSSDRKVATTKNTSSSHN